MPQQQLQQQPQPQQQQQQAQQERQPAGQSQQSQQQQQRGQQPGASSSASFLTPEVKEAIVKLRLVKLSPFRVLKCSCVDCVLKGVIRLMSLMREAIQSGRGIR